MPDPLPPSPVREHLALALVPELGPKRTRAVLDRFGSPAAALAATAAQLEPLPNFGPKVAARIADAMRAVDVSAEWGLIQKFGVSVVPLGDPAYPEPLAAFDDGPPLLYFCGGLTPADRQAVGIVGSRHCTAYGRKMAERLAAGLVRAGFTVISGLARGIDGVAHRAALDAGGRTVAVLAGGLSRIYPSEHTALADEIAGRGALMTETPMTVDPQPGMFPARNRIISALSRAVVVVEAGERSGALITATHAAEQGREVFAMPGNADSPASAGCLNLIRNGVRMIRDVDDLLEDLRGLRTDPPPARKRSPTPTLFDPPAEVSPPLPPPPPAGPPPDLTDTQRRLWEHLSEPRHVDDIARDLSMPAGELVRVLTMLEMKRVVRKQPGNVYARRDG
jgi:DNA processing protein